MTESEGTICISVSTPYSGGLLYPRPRLLDITDASSAV